jgi:hypothetical protein
MFIYQTACEDVGVCTNLNFLIAYAYHFEPCDINVMMK